MLSRLLSQNSDGTAYAALPNRAQKYSKENLECVLMIPCFFNPDLYVIYRVTVYCFVIRIMFPKKSVKNWGGGASNPIFAHGKMCVFPFSPWGKMGKKVYGKKGKSIHFPLFPYTFFPIFPHGKNGKTRIFPWAKMGLDPPPPKIPFRF